MNARAKNDFEREVQVMGKLVITKKEDKCVTMTIRVDKTLQEEYNNLAVKTNRSRNELIGMAPRYALENMELKIWSANT